MRRLTLVGAVACLSAAFIAGATFGHAKSKVTNLFHSPLSEDFVPGREVLVDLVEIPPNTTLDRHWHPGEEFHYYLAGSPEVQVQGRPVAHPKPGTVGHVPYKAMHRTGAGESGAKIIVFRVHAKGEPWRYLEDEHPEGHDAIRQ